MRIQDIFTFGWQALSGYRSRTLLMQTPDGQITEPYSLSAGLDYPGIGPLHAHLIASGRAEAISITAAVPG